MDLTRISETHDLRGPAVQYKRDKTKAQKWALTPAPKELYDSKSGNNDLNGVPAQPAPRKPIHPHQRVNAAIRRYNGREINKLNHIKAVGDRYDVLEQLDSAGLDNNNDVSERSDLSSPRDEGVMYSFDASRGPQRGSQVLVQAVSQAVERFEGQQTDKLIKEEYEVVQTEAEAEPARKARGPKKVVMSESDGFEII